MNFYGYACVVALVALLLATLYHSRPSRPRGKDDEA